MARVKHHSAFSGRSISAARTDRSAGCALAPSRSGELETVVLESRGGKTVTVSPAAAKVLRAAEDLRETVSRDWKQ